MNKILLILAFLPLLFLQPVYGADSAISESIEELSVYVTNEAAQPLYVQYFTGASWESSNSKGSQLVPEGSVNSLAKEGITCFAEVGTEGIAKDLKNVITVQIYDNSSSEAKMLGTETIKRYLYNTNPITKDKGNYLHIVISKDYKIRLNHVGQLFDERKKEYGRLPRLIGLVSLVLFIFLGVILKKKFSLGLLFLTIHSFVAIMFISIDTMSAISTGSSGFALIPIVFIDFPAFLVSAPLSAFITNFIPSPLNNATAVIIQDTILHKVAFAIPMMIFGGLQWYSIGWFISKRKKA